jgi:tungstate transport system substrate-binding protein
MELKSRFLLAVIPLMIAATLTISAQGKFITVASTTSTEQSGLFRYLLPIFGKTTGIQVRIVAVGTGQALDMGRRGDADVVFVHDPQAEKKFIDEGFGVNYRQVMYNDFILIGPRADRARIGGVNDVLEAFRKILASRAPFVSRGDRSGTHAAELRYWAEAGIDIAKQKGPWYRETGSGMGPALNTASSIDAYILADRATWLSFRNRGNLRVLVESDRRLFNQYGIMLASPAKHPHVKKALGETFIDWVTSPEGQRAIASFRVGGEQVFFPNSN